ncbi:MAG TPA: hypothetical protein VN039_08305 [Nitrospira sp.]|jgi:hypothetical protein|nr:hypothetical protein [Nitrospira sp.]
MTITINETDFELFEHLDFEHVTPCDGEGCGEEAKWRAVATCCGRVILACEECHQTLVNAQNVFGVLIDYACVGEPVMRLSWYKL